MVNLNVDPEYVPGVKLGLHSFQIIFSFCAWVLELIVFRSKDAKVTGKNGWMFAVCFLTVPAWIYLVGTPRFERTRRFAQPYAMFAVDVLFTIIWISGFAAQASYNAADQCGKGCSYSKGVVGLGVLVFLLFIGSSLVSAYTVHYYRFTDGKLPGYDNRPIRGGENIDPDKAAFSMAPHDEEAYERIHGDDHEASGSGYNNGVSYDNDNSYNDNSYGGNNHGYNDNSYGGNNNHDTFANNSYGSSGRYGDANPYSAEDSNPTNYSSSVPPRLKTPIFDSDTEYHSGGPAAMPYATPANDPFNDGPNSMPYATPPSDPYKDGPAHFPAGNYDRTH